MNTAVQQLIDYMEENYHLTEESKNQFKVALETEKQQIIDAWKNGYIDGLKDGVSDEVDDSTAEQYYSQTYKQD